MKHLKKSILLILVFLSFSSIFAQNTFNDKLTAFSASYEKEYTYDYDNAIKALEKVYIESSYEMNLRLGWLYYLKADHTKSISFYKKALVQNPNSIELKLMIVNPLSYLGNWDDIVSIYESILKNDDKNYTVNYRLGLIWYNRKKSSQALTYIKKIQPLYPFDYELNLLSGKINIALGNISDAKTALQQAILYNPTATEPIELIKGL
ncbi:MAG: tetratricopeptide repeat protein [Flavobacteriales bacterium]